MIKSQFNSLVTGTGYPESLSMMGLKRSGRIGLLSTFFFFFHLLRQLTFFDTSDQPVYPLALGFENESSPAIAFPVNFFEFMRNSDLFQK
jgi:hypothetical protein